MLAKLPRPISTDHTATARPASVPITSCWPPLRLNALRTPPRPARPAHKKGGRSRPELSGLTRSAPRQGARANADRARMVRTQPESGAAEGCMNAPKYSGAGSCRCCRCAHRRPGEHRLALVLSSRGRRPPRCGLSPVEPRRGRREPSRGQEARSWRCRPVGPRTAIRRWGSFPLPWICPFRFDR